jgi:hypothetical protein
VVEVLGQIVLEVHKVLIQVLQVFQPLLVVAVAAVQVHLLAALVVLVVEEALLMLLVQQAQGHLVKEQTAEPVFIPVLTAQVAAVEKVKVAQMEPQQFQEKAVMGTFGLTAQPMLAAVAEVDLQPIVQPLAQAVVAVVALVQHQTQLLVGLERQTPAAVQAVQAEAELVSPVATAALVW